MRCNIFGATAMLGIVGKLNQHFQTIPVFTSVVAQQAMQVMV